MHRFHRIYVFTALLATALATWMWKGPKRTATPKVQRIPSVTLTTKEKEGGGALALHLEEKLLLEQRDHQCGEVE